MRFRPNLVVSGGEPYAEDRWRNLKIGNNCFTVSHQHLELANIWFLPEKVSQKKMSSHKLWLFVDNEYDVI